MSDKVVDFSAARQAKEEQVDAYCSDMQGA